MDRPDVLPPADTAALAPARQRNLARELLHRSSWLMLGSALGRAAPLLLLIVAGRTLDSQQFASASIGFAWSGVAVSLAGAGLAMTLTQRLGATDDVAWRRSLLRQHLRWAVVLAALLALAVVAAGERAGLPLFGRAFAPSVLLPAALAGAFWTLTSVGIAALNGCHRPRAAAGVMVRGGVLQGSAMALGWALGRSGETIVWGLACGSLAAAVWAGVAVRRELGLGWSDLFTGPRTAPRQRRAWRPIVWNTVAVASILPVSLYASSIVARAAGELATLTMARYFALEQVHQLLVYAPAIVAQAALPLLAQRHGNDQLAFRGVSQRVVTLSWASAAALIMVAALLLWDSSWFVRLFANPALSIDDDWAIRWMGFNAALALALGLTGGTLVASGRIVLASLLNVGWAALFIVLVTAWAAGGVEALQRARFVASCTLMVVNSACVWWLLQRRETGT